MHLKVYTSSFFSEPEAELDSIWIPLFMSKPSPDLLSCTKPESKVCIHSAKHSISTLYNELCRYEIHLPVKEMTHSTNYGKTEKLEGKGAKTVDFRKNKLLLKVA